MALTKDILNLGKKVVATALIFFICVVVILPLALLTSVLVAILLVNGMIIKACDFLLFLWTDKDEKERKTTEKIR